MLTPKTHGIIDYGTVLLFLVAPSLLYLSEAGTLLAYTLATVHLFMTIVTNFPLGIIKLVPFKFHGLVELVVGVLLTIGPWLTSSFFSDAGLIFYTIIGVIILIVRFATSYRTT